MWRWLALTMATAATASRYRSIVAVDSPFPFACPEGVPSWIFRPRGSNATVVAAGAGRCLLGADTIGSLRFSDNSTFRAVTMFGDPRVPTPWRADSLAADHWDSPLTASDLDPDFWAPPVATAPDCTVSVPGTGQVIFAIEAGTSPSCASAILSQSPIASPFEADISISIQSPANGAASVTVGLMSDRCANFTAPLHAWPAPALACSAILAATVNATHVLLVASAASDAARVSLLAVTSRACSDNDLTLVVSAHNLTIIQGSSCPTNDPNTTTTLSVAHGVAWGLFGLSTAQAAAMTAPPAWSSAYAGLSRLIIASSELQLQPAAASSVEVRWLGVILSLVGASKSETGRLAQYPLHGPRRSLRALS